MPQINQLPLLDTVSSGDQLPVYSPNNGDARRLQIGELFDYFLQSIGSPTLTSNIYTPSTGFNITVPFATSNQWMLLQPLATLATGTITLPHNSTLSDGVEVLVTTTQQITGFSLALNGASLAYGVPTTLAAEDFFRIRYVSATNSWYRIA